MSVVRNSLESGSRQRRSAHAEIVRQERQTALRMLLKHPLMTATGPHATEFALIRRHAGWLRNWFASVPGWNLVIDSELARLQKTSADFADGTHPARDRRNGMPFSRRRYVLLCLALAALERSDRQTALGKIAEEVRELFSTEPAFAAAGMQFDLKNQDHRRDLVQVARSLLDLQILTRVHGEEEQFLNEVGDVLYRINRPVLAMILNVRRGPSTITALTLDDRIPALAAALPATSDEERARQIQRRLTRRLLETPVLYEAELSEEERQFWQAHRGRIVRELEAATGLIPEIRREGTALVDERGDQSDIAMPAEGTLGHAMLLLADYFAAALRRGESLVSRDAVIAHMHELTRLHQHHWRQGVSRPGAAEALANEALAQLEALKLVRRTSDGVQPLPGIARYAASPPAGTERTTTTQHPETPDGDGNRERKNDE